jgi:hypothetical protein
VNVKNDEGETPIDMAIRLKRTETAFAAPTHNAAKTVDLANVPAALCPD